jgi:hypothetical protein
MDGFESFAEEVSGTAGGYEPTNPAGQFCHTGHSVMSTLSADRNGNHEKAGILNMRLSCRPFKVSYNSFIIRGQLQGR